MADAPPLPDFLMDVRSAPKGIPSLPESLSDFSGGTAPAKDIVKGVGAGLMNTAITPFGLPGDISEAGESAVRAAFGKVAEYGTRAYNYLRGESGKEVGNARLDATQKKIDALNNVSTSLGDVRSAQGYTPLPTSSQLSGAIEPYAEKIFGTGPEYQPQTGPGKFAKTVTEFVAPSPIGGSCG